MYIHMSSVLFPPLDLTEGSHGDINVNFIDKDSISLMKDVQLSLASHDSIACHQKQMPLSDVLMTCLLF
jgi:hypothetical protein